MDRDIVEVAGAETVDEGRHYDVGFYAGFKTGLDYGEVGCALGVWLLGVAFLFVRVDIVVGVGEDAVFFVCASDGLVAEIGRAGCLRNFSAG